MIAKRLGDDVNQTTEAQVEKELVQTPEGQEVLHQRAIHRVVFASSLVIALGVFLLWVPAPLRDFFLSNLIANRFLIVLLFFFALLVVSLLWSFGQRLDVWLFNALNLRGYHAIWLDRAMWLATQIGNVRFTAVLAAGAYLLGARNFAIGLVLGSLTLWLLVTAVKALTDRARPFNLLRETKVIGLHEPGLSFPSGHTAQTFFTATLVLNHFQWPLGLAVGMYGIAVLVGVTRVYLGVHYPRDVVAGAILALIWSSISLLVASYV